MSPDARRPRARLYYHVFHPSGNVSARHWSDLAEGLVRRGWEVTACPANRDYPDGRRTFPLSDAWHGVRIERVWRPAFNQSRNLGRLLNAAWMIAAWGLQAFKRRRPDVVVIGTDPILGLLAALPWRWTRPRIAIVHWGFDIYPEAAIADGMLDQRSLPVRALTRLLRAAYRACDLIVDIGSCMRRLIGRYGSRARCVTLTPWALVEPDEPAVADESVRQELFGDATLCLLYSGTFGRAHGYEEMLALARKLHGEPIAFCFAGRGNRADQLRAAVTPEDANIRFAGFAAESELEKRLGAADVHLASLRQEWTGTVVPSKFFGSLAVGRPVIFAGAPDAAIAGWLREHDVGWLLTGETVDAVAESLRELARSPERLRDMQERCHRVYREHFSREHVLDAWDRELRQITGFKR